MHAAEIVLGFRVTGVRTEEVVYLRIEAGVEVPVSRFLDFIGKSFYGISFSLISNGPEGPGHK